MQLTRKAFYRLLTGLILAPVVRPRDSDAAVHRAALYTEWKGGSGQWTDAAMWSAGKPNAFKIAAVDGNSRVTIPRGTYVAGLLKVGTRPGDQARVEMNGGQLLIRQDSLIIGDRTNSQGSFILNDGAFYDAMDVFVGGPTATAGRMNKSALIVKGGTFVALTLTMGEGLGADSSVAVEGSRATAISALEFVAILASADPSGKPGVSTLSFTLDEHGVTPISIHSRWWGLRIKHDRRSHCYLRIGLSAVPPREDITLVTSRVSIEGTFDGLPEGSKISARYVGRTYQWILTYKGGASGLDLVLKNRSEYAADSPRTHVLPLPKPPRPVWWGHPVYPLSIPAGRIVFPGAEGYGAYARGGSGGRKLYVDNLNDAGPGSLRAAVEAVGPRIVIFRVGGTISLTSPLMIGNPYLTFDAGNAPGPGIMLRRNGIVVHTHDVVLRQFRIRIGDEDVQKGNPNILYAAGDGKYALYFTDGSRNCIADHLSLSWSTNKILSTTTMTDLITVQWCILSESLNIDGHGYASIASGNRVSWHHNLFAHNYSRNVRFQGSVDADFRNNVIYDWGEKSAYGEFDRLNYVGNYLKPGPSTTQSPLLFMDGKAAVAPGSLFLSGNVLVGSEQATRDNWTGSLFYFERRRVEAARPFPAPPVMTESAAAAYNLVLEKAGATLPRRDEIDSRIVREAGTGTGHVIESVRQAGGWPKF